jgi:hypothetical protein
VSRYIQGPKAIYKTRNTGALISQGIAYCISTASLARSQPQRSYILSRGYFKTAIEELGTFFNVDPWFFASYVHQSWRKTSAQGPTNCHYRAPNARFLAATVTSNSVIPCERRKALKKDYKFIQTEVFEHGERLEAMVPLVTSAASLIESRRSLSETANVTRLTILAIVMIPLSYVASIFSMSENFRPGELLFCVYLVTAVPLAVFIGLIAKPPMKIGKKVLQISSVDKLLQ